MLDKWLVALVSPLGTSLLLGLFACLLALFKKRRGALIWGFIAWVWLLVWSLPLTSDALYRWVTRDYQPVEMSNVPQADMIILLGGGISPADRLNPSADLNQAADRMMTAAQLYHAGKASKILLSGGTDSHYLNSEAQAMANMLMLLGIPKSVLILEESSRNTRENATFSSSNLQAESVKRALLVTSALHMRRALNDFSRAGIELTAVPTDFEARARATWRQFIPSTQALDVSARAFKEWLAWLAQKTLSVLGLSP